MDGSATPAGGDGRGTVETQGGDVRQRAVALIQEAGTLLGMIPQLLDRTEELKANVDSTGKETDSLRKEVAALRGEVQQLKADREEMADSLTVIMNDILRLTNEAVAKLRGPERRSAFWREGHTAAGESAPVRPAPAVPWKRMGE
jgi:chromosome segregation ATPase